MTKKEALEQGQRAVQQQEPALTNVRAVSACNATHKWVVFVQATDGATSTERLVVLDAQQSTTYWARPAKHGSAHEPASAASSTDSLATAVRSQFGVLRRLANQLSRLN